MTTATVQLCGHRWWTDKPACGYRLDWHHLCELDAGHADPCPCPDGTCTVHCTNPPVHRCRCGATTTRGDD